MIPRTLNLSKYLEKNRSFFLFGPRNTGKTSLIRESLKNTADVFFLDLLAPENFRRYMIQPDDLGLEIETYLMNQEKKKPKLHLVVVIDEVQKIPSLLDEVHRLIEKHKSNISFILTGSSARKLKRSGANLLAGRAITLNLHPLSAEEIDVNLKRALQFGTLPSIYLTQGFEIESLESYVNTYLREEILEESLVRQIDRFTRFLELAGQLSGEPINFSKLAKQINISIKTAQEYFSILTDTLITLRVDGWSHSIKKQLLQAPKFYFFDPGVLNAINGELRAELKTSSFRFGRLFELFVVQEIKKISDYHNLGFRINYWRDKDGHEVDLILSQSTGRPFLAIEIKSSSSPTLEDVNGFEYFRQDYPKVKRWCLCTTPRAYEKGGVEFLPWQEGIRNLASQK